MFLIKDYCTQVLLILKNQLVLINKVIFNLVKDFKVSNKIKLLGILVHQLKLTPFIEFIQPFHLNHQTSHLVRNMIRA